MLRFYADKFIESFNILIISRGLLTTLKKQFNDDASKNEKLPERMRSELISQTSSLRDQLQEMGLRMSVHACNRLLSKLEKDPKAFDPDLEFGLNDIHNRLKDELSDCLLFSVDRDKSRYYDNGVPPFGDKVAEQFRDASYHIEEAGKCYALSRSTACVFHLMCALDIALKRLCKEINLPRTEASWGAIFQDIEKKVRSLPDTKDPHDDKTFYSEALAHLYNAKDAWRNHMAHGRDKYTEEEALNIYNSVHSFMMGFAERLSE